MRNYSGVKSAGWPANADLEFIRLRACLRGEGEVAEDRPKNLSPAPLWGNTLIMRQNQEFTTLCDGFTVGLDDGSSRFLKYLNSFKFAKFGFAVVWKSRQARCG